MPRLFTSRSVSQSEVWFFTINNPSEEDKIESIKGLKYICYQLERGKKTGTLHMHIYCHWTSRKRKSSILKIWPRAAKILVPNCPDKCRSYCMKEDTRVEGPWEFGEYEKLEDYRVGQGSSLDLKEACELVKKEGIDSVAEKMPEVFVRHHRGLQALHNKIRPPIVEEFEYEMREDEKNLLIQLGEKPNFRTIFWIWSYESEKGKTRFLNFVCSKFSEKIILGCEREMDTLYLVNDKTKIIWFNVPRQQPLDAKFTSQLENLSDGGLKASTKYETKMKLVSAHIVVTCNRPPPHEKLPKRIIELNWN